MPRTSRRPAQLLAAMAIVITCAGRLALAADGGAGKDASTAGGADGTRAAQVLALIAGTLDPSVEPSSLFDLAFQDDSAVAIEAARLRVLLGAVDASSKGAARPRASTRSAAVPRTDLEALPAMQWDERLELDRARLAFYSLTPERRQQLLLDHAARRAAVQPKETEAQRRARDAEEQRVRAAEAARLARSEAEKVVAEELASLATIDSAIASEHVRLAAARDQLMARKSTVLGWQRRIREARAHSPTEIDEVYDSLRRALRASRDELDDALDALHSKSSELPTLAPSRLSSPFATSSIIARAELPRTRSSRESCRQLMRPAGWSRSRRRRSSSSMLQRSTSLLGLQSLALATSGRADVTRVVSTEGRPRGGSRRWCRPATSPVYVFGPSRGERASIAFRRLAHLFLGFLAHQPPLDRSLYPVLRVASSRRLAG